MTVPSRRSKNETVSSTTDADLKHQSRELGWLGRVFGSRENAPVNIAGLIVILGLIGILFTPSVADSASFSRADWIKALTGLVFAALTFLGGYLGGGRSKL